MFRALPTADGGLTVQRRVRPFRRIVLVEDAPNPTSAYYLLPRLSAPGPDLVVAALRRPEDIADAALDGALLLFCRYVSPAWLRRAERAPIAGVGILIDDDMVAIRRERTASWHYRRKLWLRSLAQHAELSRQLGCLFVSTPALAERLGAGAARVLPPLAGDDDLGPPPAPRRNRLAFHATAVHRAEHAWLVPVIRALLATAPALEIEIVANRHDARLWRGDPHIAVIPQRDWPDYRRATAAAHAGVMLAPLVPGAANAARAPVKRIDAGRSGAALIVSDPTIYGVSAEEAALGMAIPLDPESWSRGLAALLADPARCDKLAAVNRSVLRDQRAHSKPLCVPLPQAGLWQLGDPGCSD